jgi:hypothetical protein
MRERNAVEVSTHAGEFLFLVLPSTVWRCAFGRHHLGREIEQIRKLSIGELHICPLLDVLSLICNCFLTMHYSCTIIDTNVVNVMRRRSLAIAPWRVSGS